ncbi:probable G-protein coupled receptor 139 [Camarhynchus parvulus]|uniref:G protein-coupled receptor 139 n=7 Tax=Passeriformes TaxID=9126 RepID=A0A8C3Q6A2_GEOPR|nr:probable G-protein coupled receptor 139 [Camarhynchus parvulus]NWR15803.1 GP139 protein [Emberiza fucata]NWZ96412.1 GP139 protein [Nesospiza acunhae]NXF16786.1 GP139 protein [Rhodinocichla rosea]NXP83550.1 GP139 protein [Passerina amoena]
MEHNHLHLHNGSLLAHHRYGCGLGYAPVVYYSLLLCLGLPANILTVIILSQLVARRQKSSYNYLLALAAADILVLFFIVFVDFLMEDFILNKQMPQVLDKIIEVLEFSSIHTSIWITVPLTIDRYIAVCHPLRYHTVSYPARTRKVIVSVYITCFLTSIPYYWWPNIWIEDYISTSMHHVLIWVHCFTVYLVPCSIFFILNSIIVYKLRRKSNFRLRGYSTGKTTAILFTITSIFAILWAPRIIMILYHLYVSPINNSWLVHIVSDIANMLALLNTAINFFLYCFISKRFRTMAAATLKAFFKCQKQPVQFYTNHNFSITSSPWISPANSHCIKMLVYQYDKNGKPIKISP